MRPHPPGRRSADYITILQQAWSKIAGFDQLNKDLERSISISGKSQSTLTNYSRQLAHLALHYQALPIDLDAEQVMDSVSDYIKRNYLGYLFQVYRLWSPPRL